MRLPTCVDRRSAANASPDARSTSDIRGTERHGQSLDGASRSGLCASVVLSGDWHLPVCRYSRFAKPTAPSRLPFSPRDPFLRGRSPEVVACFFFLSSYGVSPTQRRRRCVTIPSPVPSPAMRAGVTRAQSRSSLLRQGVRPELTAGEFRRNLQMHEVSELRWQPPIAGRRCFVPVMSVVRYQIFRPSIFLTHFPETTVIGRARLFSSQVAKKLCVNERLY